MSENKENKDLETLDEDEKLLLDYDYDGIKEFDNPIPPWLMFILYASIFFAAVYYVNLHVFKTGKTEGERYALEMERAETALAQKNGQVEKVELKPLTDPQSIAAGEAIFRDKICATCHGHELEGNTVGPNLTDDYWIHGNTIENLAEMIKNGNLQKGMTPFKNQLTDKEILEVASFVLSRHGSNPPNAKAPQGDKY